MAKLKMFTRVWHSIDFINKSNYMIFADPIYYPPVVNYNN